jgi:glutamate-1-semialdehyde 2,1-aminomutase
MAIVDEYVARTPRSRAVFERASRSIPGGSTRTTVYAYPYPPYMASGRGLEITDVDGNTYRDFLGNYTSLIVGHAHPDVVAAVQRQAAAGSAFAAPTLAEIELAEEIRRRTPSIEQLRFTTSGTEATMFAIRAARAHTGRSLIAKFDHSYHGTHDLVMAGTAGVPDAIGGLIVELPWADREGIEAALRGREHELAAILLEPVQGAGGVRAPEPGFLEYLRALADRLGALLIFDEIISYRLAKGGAQEIYGVRPDLTTLGKIIAGGYALAAFGGRADVMSIFDARRPGAISHGGTFNGNPIAASAGLATLKLLTPDAYRRLDELGARLETNVREELDERRLPVQFTRVGSLFQLFDGGDQTTFATGADQPNNLFLGMLLEGFAIAPRGMGSIPTVATETDIDELARALGRVLSRIAAEAREAAPTRETVGAA